MTTVKTTTTTTKKTTTKTTTIKTTTIRCLIVFLSSVAEYGRIWESEAQKIKQLNEFIEYFERVHWLPMPCTHLWPLGPL